MTSHIGQYLNFILLVEPNHNLEAADFWNKTKLKAFKFYMNQKNLAANTIANKLRSLARVNILIYL